MRVSVIVPVYNSPDLLWTCYQGLQRTDYPISMIFVDNGSQDIRLSRIYDLIEMAGHKVIYNTENLGFSKAVNIGYKWAKDSDAIILYNQDCLNPGHGWVRNIVKMFMEKPECAVQGALLTYPGTNIIQHAGIVFPPGNTGAHIYQGTSMLRPEVQVSCRYAAVTGAVMAIRSEVFSSLCGFSEAYKLDCEDSDFCLRVLRDMDKEVWYNHEVHVEHINSEIKRRTPDAMSMLRGSPRLFLSRWSSFLSTLPDEYKTYIG